MESGQKTDQMGIIFQPQTASMAMPISADTASRIRETASKPGELALAPVYENLPGIMRDFRLSTLPFQNEPIEKIVMGVMLRGTASQKSAMIGHLPFECGFAFPEVSAIFSGDIQKWETGIGFIAAQIENLAAFMGSNVPGDVKQVAEYILEQYGGLSPVDFVRFFKLCRDGEFRTEFQNVATRGVNAEFLIDWLNQYCEKRELIWLQLVADSKNNVSVDPETAVDRPVELIAREKRLAALERDAQQRRVEFDAALTEIAHIEYWTKPVTMIADVEGETGQTRKIKKIVQMPCDPDDPERAEREIIPYKRDKHGAAYKRLIFFIQTFVTVGDDPIPIAKKLIDGWRDEFSKIEKPTITFEDYARAESTRFVNNGKRLLSKLGASEIIRATLSEKTGRPAISLNEPAQTVIRQIHSNWIDYLEACLKEPDAYPLKMDEFMIHFALVWAKQSGFPFGFEIAILNTVDSPAIAE